ncbi:MAG: cellulase family glycosylhydrolase [Burkholderiaceae bacterium]
MTPPSSAHARKLCAAVAALLLVGGLADPSGIFTWIGWTGSPVAATWWWAPYAVYLPTVLASVFLGARWSAPVANVTWRRSRAFFGDWALLIVATGLGSLLGALVALAPMAWRGEYVIGWGTTWGFVAWSSGYAALKMGLVGWLPAALAQIGPREPASFEAFTRRPGVQTLERLVCGLVALAIALMGPWLAAHWWQGSPMGYTYAWDVLVLAPTPASGVLPALLSLVVFVGLLRWCVWRRLAVTRADDLRSTFMAGAVAGLGAVVGLLLGQAYALAPPLHTHPPHADLWALPALFVHAVDAASFGMLAALVTGLAAVVATLAQRVTPARADRLLRLAGIAAFILALGIEFAAARTFERPVFPTRIPVMSPAPGELSPLTISADHTQIVDASGARVTLRGFNVNQLGDYFHRDPALATVQALTEQDFADIASLGLNVVRLTLSWSLLEPEPGHVSQAYLERIRQALAWAKAHQVRVLLDMHQDGWSASVGAPAGTRCRAGADPMTGWDGAPAWATLTDATPPCMVSGRDLAPNVSRAFQSFYVDRDGVQTRLVHDWQVLAAAFGDDTTIVGYDLLNEPNFGEQPPIASTLLLSNYYARAIAAIRAGEAQRPHGYAHLVLLEPSILWSGFGIDNLPPRGFTADTQVVFSPHLYNESITADQDFGVTLVSVERGYALAAGAAAQLHAPLWIGEWGYFGSAAKDAPMMQRSADAEDMSSVGSTFWVWKQGCSDPHVWPGSVAGNVRLLACPDMRDIGTAAARTRVLTRAYVRVSADADARLHASGDTLTLDGRFERHGEGCALQVWVPGDTAPRLADVSGMSAPQVTRQAPGSAALGASGGWLVDACLAGGAWHATLAR